MEPVIAIMNPRAAHSSNPASPIHRAALDPELIGEVLAPLMALIGWQTRIAGLLMAANMVVAIFLAHMHQLTEFTGNGGWALELQGLFLFGAVALVFLGSGRMAWRPD